MNEHATRTTTDGARSAVGLVALALAAEAALHRLARGGGLLDLALGEALDALASCGGLVRLGFVRITDYARERLGVPASTALSWIQLARELRDCPILRRAVRTGFVSPRKALLVARVARDGDEEAWTAAAASLTERKLRKLVRDGGGSVPHEWSTTRFEVRMPEDLRDQLDAGLAMAREILGPDRPRWQLLEALAMEFLGSHPELIPEGDAPEPEPPAPPDVDGLETWRERSAEILRRLDALEEADALLAGGVPVESDGPHALHERLRRLLRARRGFDGPLGRQASVVRELRAWRYLGYDGWEEYCRERLGLSVRTLQQRIWLEDRMLRLPALREALEDGRLKYTQALEVARGATALDVDRWIERVRGTTVQQAAREAGASEDAQNRGEGVCKIWGEEDAMETVRLAILCAQALAAAEGRTIDEGEALVMLANHFVEVWGEHARRRRAEIGQGRLLVLERTGGLCAVPGCSRPAEHEHHVRFRSRGGGEEPHNRLPACDLHHLFGIHGGVMGVEGLAGERLIWRMPDPDGDGAEVWMTEGDDDVRRVVGRG